MKFLCLIYHDEAELAAFTAAQMKVLDHDSEAYDRTLEKAGHMIFAHALRPARTARTVRMRGKKTMITDGPFAESKEQLIGFILIEAQDADEAMQLAKEIPLAKTGTVEVRPAFDPFA
ncbi:YciI family protein [Mesorhizobium sp. BE184]|uniref:YciI family protein n=1 Tax=Mesorhizobium sp. BE184 TaxID=2817714 RepID=UPI0028567AA9|nr:YciI family protein [Mesorhizobium sp. BE184]MDR7033968.1 hypothetical protein [Mesorhizobium sp. BE184]